MQQASSLGAAGIITECRERPTDAGLAQEGGDSSGEAAAAALLAVGEGEEQSGAVLVIEVHSVRGGYHQIGDVLQRAPADLLTPADGGRTDRQQGSEGPTGPAAGNVGTGLTGGRLVWLCIAPTPIQLSGKSDRLLS